MIARIAFHSRIPIADRNDLVQVFAQEPFKRSHLFILIYMPEFMRQNTGIVLMNTQDDHGVTQRQSANRRPQQAYLRRLFCKLNITRAWNFLDRINPNLFRLLNSNRFGKLNPSRVKGNPVFLRS